MTTDHWLNMRKLGYSDFAIQTWKLAARLSISCLLFPYPAIIQHSTVQKYPACFVLNRWLLQWFGVYLTWSSHFARAFHELQCIVRVISAARFENTWPAHSAFEKGMETVSQTGKNYSDRTYSFFFSIFCISSLTKSDRRSSLHIVILFSQETFQPSNTFRKENGSYNKVPLQ